MMRVENLEFVVETIKRRQLVGGRETFALTNGENQIAALGSFFERIAFDHLPVIEHTLWERLSASGGTQRSRETKRLEHRQVCANVVQRRARTRRLFDDGTATLIEARVDTTDHRLRALDLDQVDRLHEARRGRVLRRVHDTTCRRHDLTATAMDGIGVQRHIKDLVQDTALVLFAHETFARHPLETGDDRVFDLVQVLHTFGGIDDDVRAFAVWSKAPDFACQIGIKVVLLQKRVIY